jgi:hypothetical protein
VRVATHSRKAARPAGVSDHTVVVEPLLLPRSSPSMSPAAASFASAAYTWLCGADQIQLCAPAKNRASAYPFIGRASSTPRRAWASDMRPAYEGLDGIPT